MRRSISTRVMTAAAVLAVAIPASAMAASADLSIDKSDGADPVTLGSDLSYSIAVANAGPESATGVAVTDELPNHVDFISATPTQGSCDRSGRNVTCELGTLANGATATVVIKVTPKRAGQFVNTATVSSPDTDPYAPNNFDSETTTVVEPATPTCAGRDATIVGTSGDDTLTGTKKADVIVAFSGDDAIFGLDGNDVICALGGNDFVKGRAGNDLVRGGGGDDSLGGGPGDDVLRGGAGSDSCRGGPGSDVKRSC